MKRYTPHLAIVIMLIGSAQNWVLGQGIIKVESEGGSEYSGIVSSALDTVSDSVEFRPKKYAARHTWEKAISFPLEITFFPVELFFEGTKATIGFVDDSKLIPRLKYLLTCDDGSCGVIPTYASLSGGGVKIYQKGWLGPESKFDLSLTAGPNRRQSYQLRFRYNKLFNKAISSDYRIRYRMLPDERYFFLNIKTDETNFAHEQFIGEATFRKEFGKARNLNIIFGINVNNMLEGRGESIPTSKFISKEKLPGLGEQVKLIRLELGAQHDSKNRPGNPTGGIEARATTGIYSQVGDDKFGFWKGSFDFKHFINLFYDRVLMLRITGELTEPFSSREIPFYYLSELGRNGTIRGFERGRFRDRDMVLGSLEYRYSIWMHGIDALLFIDAGKVTPDIFNDNSWNNFNVSYGTGIRIWSPEGLVSKLEIGWSDDGMRIHFGLN
ncbi:MAG: BamA/TamA family outer membrane protein [Candidatus Marinimicrobia bacterium]|nr:BamA/TamA family outer membrane protein [Candidatus Neomarinimicrobiota bacterium]